MQAEVVICIDSYIALLVDSRDGRVSTRLALLSDGVSKVSLVELHKETRHLYISTCDHSAI